MGLTVSVILPVYNSGAFIDEAIASVGAQTFEDLELIVVDDGSTDDTPDRLAKWQTAWRDEGRRLVLVMQQNKGAGAARNAGIARAGGTYLVFMDSDDRLYPTLIERLVARLQDDPTADIAFPNHRYIDATGAPIGYESRAPKDRFDGIDLMIENPIHSATGVVARRDAVLAAGGFDTTLPACIDLDLWVRIGMQRSGNILAEREVLVDYRKRAGQITSSWERMKRGWTRVSEKLTEAGRPLSGAELRRARAARSLYWSSIAYEAGDHAAARRLVATVWMSDPGYALRNRLALIRTLACAATFLPPRLHDALRRTYNRGLTGG